MRYVVEKHTGAGGKADDIPEHEGRYPNLHTGSHDVFVCMCSQQPL